TGGVWPDARSWTSLPGQCASLQLPVERLDRAPGTAARGRRGLAHHVRVGRAVGRAADGLRSWRRSTDFRDVRPRVARRLSRTPPALPLPGAKSPPISVLEARILAGGWTNRFPPTSIEERVGPSILSDPLQGTSEHWPSKDAGGASVNGNGRA